jgi:hypothetical protein
MAIINRWDNPEKTVIYAFFDGDWEMEDLIDSSAQIKALMDTVHTPVDVIADLSQSGKPPSSFIAHFTEIRHSNFADHPNANRLYMVGTTKFNEMIAKAFAQFGGLGSRLFIFDTVDDAYQHISQ